MKLQIAPDWISLCLSSPFKYLGEPTVGGHGTNEKIQNALLELVFGLVILGYRRSMAVQRGGYTVKENMLSLYLKGLFKVNENTTTFIIRWSYTNENILINIILNFCHSTNRCPQILPVDLISVYAINSHTSLKHIMHFTATAFSLKVSLVYVFCVFHFTDITGGQLEHCWSMTLASTWPMRAQSDGWRSCSTMETLTLWWCWWETRQIWRPSGLCPQTRPETLQVG